VTICVPVVSEEEELYAVEETFHADDAGLAAETRQRLYGRQQISFAVCFFH